jgi:uncharacterized protein (DUF58 family)
VAALLATLPIAFAAAEPGLAAAGLAADALLVAGLLFDHRRARAATVSARRTWPTLLVQGARATVEIEMQGPPGAVVVVRETLHPGLADSPLRASVALDGGGAGRWSYVLVPRRRGEHHPGPLTVRVPGPLGLAWAQRDLLGPEPRRVYPQVRWDGAVGRVLALAHRRQLGLAPVRAHGAGAEPYALREYRPGDPPRRIHWKATARHGRPIAREDTWERGNRVVVLLDCARAMASVDDRRSKLDHALAAALALARVAAARGDRVTVVAFDDRVQRVVRIRSRGAAAAYRALYDVEARLVEPAYDAAAEEASRLESRSATVVMLTSVVDLAAADLLREALRTLARRHRVLLVNLEDAQLASLARRAPATVEEAFAKASAMEILLVNRRLVRELRRDGVWAATTGADRLAWQALESYLGPRAARGSVTPLAS